MTDTPVRYQTMLMDSARWNAIELREGDIIVSTPAKCGTTWTQIICGLLVFGRPELPQRLDDLSLWVDAFFRTEADTAAHLAAQDHRRFMKSHTPLDGLPADDRVTYIGVGRDPRDAGISMDHHLANMDMEEVMKLSAASLGPEAADLAAAMPPPAPTLKERFWNWVESDDPVIGMKGMFNHIEGFWERRDDPNIVLLHYADLKADLEGQMRALAEALGIEIPEEVWPELVRAATFDEVKSKAETLAPEASVWRDKAEFFHRGSNEQWRELFDDADLDRYRERVASLTTAEINEWLHRGPV